MGFLDGLLADQELRINADRFTGSTGQAGKQGICLARLAHGPVCQGKIVAPGTPRQVAADLRGFGPDSRCAGDAQEQFQAVGGFAGMTGCQQRPGLDKARIGPETTLRKLLEKRPGMGQGGDVVARVKFQLSGSSQSIVRPRILRISFGNLQEPAASLIHLLLLDEPSAERKRKAAIKGDCGKRRPASSVVENAWSAFPLSSSSVASAESGTRGDRLVTLVNQGFEQFLGLCGAFQPRQGFSPYEMALGLQSAPRRHPIEVFEGFDGRGESSGGELALAELEQRPVRPVLEVP